MIVLPRAGGDSAISGVAHSFPFPAQQRKGITMDKSVARGFARKLLSEMQTLDATAVAVRGARAEKLCKIVEEALRRKRHDRLQKQFRSTGRLFRMGRSLPS